MTKKKLTLAEVNSPNYKPKWSDYSAKDKAWIKNAVKRVNKLGWEFK